MDSVSCLGYCKSCLIQENILIAALVVWGTTLIFDTCRSNLAAEQLWKMMLLKLSDKPFRKKSYTSLTLVCILENGISTPPKENII